MAENGKSNNNRLQVCRVIDVPLHEVSGICVRRGRNGRMHLVAVGDRVAKIAWFPLPGSDGGRIDWREARYCAYLQRCLASGGRIAWTKMDEFLNRDQPACPALRNPAGPTVADNRDPDPRPDIGAIAVIGRGTQASISAGTP